MPTFMPVDDFLAFLLQAGISSGALTCIMRDTGSSTNVSGAAIADKHPGCQRRAVEANQTFGH